MVSSGEGNGGEDGRCIRLAVFLFSVLVSCFSSACQSVPLSFAFLESDRNISGFKSKAFPS